MPDAVLQRQLGRGEEEALKLGVRCELYLLRSVNSGPNRCHIILGIYLAYRVQQAVNREMPNGDRSLWIFCNTEICSNIRPFKTLGERWSFGES